MKKIDLEKLTTESRNQNTLNIDKVSTLEMVKLINNEDKKVAEAVEAELPRIAEAIDEIAIRMNKGGKTNIYWCWNFRKIRYLRCVRMSTNLWCFRRVSTRSYCWWSRGNL